MYRFMKIFSFCLCHLPTSVAHKFGYLLGQLFWWLVPKKRKDLAVRQILQCRITEDTNEAWRIAKASSVRFGPMIVEVLCYPKYTKEVLEKKITFSHQERLEQVLAEGKGCIIAATHGGNWELLGASLATFGYPLISVAQQQNNGGADKFINEYRALLNQHVTYKTGVRDMIRFLSQGYAIGLLMDQDPGKNGILADFFGRPSLTPTGPAALAKMKQTAIVPIFIHEDRPYHHVIEVLEPVVPLSTGDKQQDILETTNRLNAILEERIRQYPEDWFWLHNRWKWTDRLHPECMPK